MPRIKVSSGEGSIRCDAVFHYPFFYKNGKPRTFDPHNCMKVLIDVIAYKGGFNDRRVKFGSWGYVDDPKEHVVVVLKEIELSEGGLLYVSKLGS